MNKSNKFSPEVRERAVRMVQEQETALVWENKSVPFSLGPRMH